jgi:hypothetical protein
MKHAAEPPDEQWLDEEAGPVVRPYAMTHGRTRPTTGEFDLISLVVATRPVSATDLGLGPEHVTIATICEHPLSVAEIASQTDLPVGIVRVLLGDLLERGLILAREPQPATHMPSERVFKAVINGLRSL